MCGESRTHGAKRGKRAPLVDVSYLSLLLDVSRGGNLDVAMTVHIRSGGKVLLMSGTFPNKKELAVLLNADMFVSKYRKTLIHVNEVHVPDDINAQPAPRKLSAGVTPTFSGHIYNRDSLRLKVLKIFS